MSRGSFSYRQKISKKIKFSLSEKKQISESELKLIYKDEKSDLQCAIRLSQKSELLYIDLEEDFPSEYNRFWLTFPKKNTFILTHYFQCTSKVFDKIHVKFLTFFTLL